MTSANRTQVAWTLESTPGTTPNTPRMRKVGYTGENLQLFNPEFLDGDKITDDRMTDDPIKVFQGSGGTLSFNLAYPPNNSPESDFIASGMYNNWTVSAERDNDGTADSVITAIATVNEQATHTTGTSFVANMLVKFSNFGVAGNNGVFKCTTGGATTSRYVGAGLTDEAVPPATARMKCVGFIGAAGDITAAAGGLASTTLDFTTLPLYVGQPIKVGGSAAGDKFATTANNAWVTISAIAAHALTLDNLPSGWSVDAGAAKTIKVWTGDFIKNGTLTNDTRISGTIEKGFLGQLVPTYLVGKGMTVNSLQIAMKHKDKARCVVTFMGQGGSESTTPLDASPDALTTTVNFSPNVNFARFMEGGSAVGTPNFWRSLELTIGNNLRAIEDMTTDAAAGINEGENLADTKLETYYGSDALLTKFYNATPTKIFAVLDKSSQAVAIYLPRQTYRGGGNPSASAKNTDVMLPLEGKASRDTTTSAHAIMSRLEYYE
jgi:hypothetical protein